MTTLKKEQQIKEILRCGKDPLYFIRTYAKIVHPIKGLIPFETFPFQDKCIDDFVKHRFNVVLKSRQVGLSTLTAAFSTWLAIFHKDKNILVIATKLTTAENFVKKVKVILRALPPWLLLPKFTDNRQSVTFSHGSQIKAVPTSEDAGRSEALSLLIVDECVTGDAKVTIRDVVTNEIHDIALKDLYLLMQLEERHTDYVYLVDDENVDETNCASSTAGL